MKFRYLDFLKDYEELLSWWNHYKWDVPPSLELLPSIGFVVERDGKKICACFLYTSNSILCMIDWFIANPFTTREERKGALDFMINEAAREAKDMGFKVSFNWIENKNLLNRLLKNGYKVNERNRINVIREL